MCVCSYFQRYSANPIHYSSYTENLCYNNYNRIEIHISYKKKSMFLYSLSIKEGLIQCLDVYEVEEAKKVFLKSLAMSELNFPKEKK